MATRKHLKVLGAVLLSAAMIVPCGAQNKDKSKDKKSEGGQPGEADMMAMMVELSKPGENHKLLAHGVGNWTYKVKMWMDPNTAPTESTGSASVKEIMGGRYFAGEHIGKMEMPGPDGKMMAMEFKGMSLE